MKKTIFLFLLAVTSTVVAQVQFSENYYTSNIRNWDLLL